MDFRTAFFISNTSSYFLSAWHVNTFLLLQYLSDLTVFVPDESDSRFQGHDLHESV